MSDDLKPCPFCGGEAELCGMVGTRYIRCTSCGCDGPIFQDTKKEAVESWNTRSDRIEELEAKLAKAEWLLVDATVQLEEGKIKTRRNRAALIRQFLAELTGGKDE